MMWRRNFLGNLSKAGIAGLLPLKKLAANSNADLPGEEDNGHKLLVEPYLQNLTNDSVTIRWISNKNCYCWVEYGEDGRLDKKLNHVTDGLTDANNRIHNITLKNLKPGTLYSYKVCSKEITDFQPYKLQFGNTIESNVYRFKTVNPSAKEVSWLVLNDIHDRPASIPALLSLNKNEPHDFVFLNGDMFDYQTDEKQIIDHLLVPCTSVFASNIQFIYTRGNHETRGKYARQLGDYFTNPGGKFYFAFSQGPVRFIVLDTGEDKDDNAEVYGGIVSFDAYREEQAMWLAGEIKSKAFRKAPFRVVMMHIPVYEAGEWHGTMHCRKLFNPLFNKGKIDLVISGHTHRYGVYKADPLTHNYPVVIGGGPLEGKRTLIKVKATEQQLNLQMLRDDGTEVGSVEVKRK